MSVEKILRTDQLKMQYDNAAKKLIANKIILAYIIGQTIEEFYGMSPEEIVPYIEGKPYIGEVYVDPGMSNGVDEMCITGFNTEDCEIHEGLIRFDVICYVRTRDGHAQIILNLEIQKDQPTQYHIMNRAIYYVCRAISSQKERDFIKSNYNDIKKVYSIWLCMNMEEDSLNHIQLQDQKILGNVTWKGNLDLLHIIMIGIESKKEKMNIEQVEPMESRMQMIQMLRILFTNNIKNKEKIDILQNKYHIICDQDIREEVETMCNLSEGIWEEAIQQGMEQGMEQGIEQGIEMKCAEIITNMHQNGFSIEQIAKIVGKTVDEIKRIIASEKIE